MLIAITYVEQAFLGGGEMVFRLENACVDEVSGEFLLCRTVCAEQRRAK